VRKFFRELLTCALAASSICLAVSSKADAALPWLHVDGNHLADPSGHQVVLRGVDTVELDVMANNQPGITWVIDRLVDGGSQGFNSRVVRLVVPPDRWANNPDSFFNSYLQPAINYCVQKDVYCIIDYHSFGENYNAYNTPEVDQQVRSFWSYVAPKFKDVPNVLYELFNEPVNPQDWNTWKQTAQPWVDLVRAAAPQNIIIVGSPAFSSFTQYAAGSPFNGSNLMYTMHLYPGCGYDNTSTWDPRFGTASQTVPVFMTEFGWDGNGDSASIQNCYNGTTSGFGKNIRNYLDNVHPNISWSVWNYGYMPGMIDSNYNVQGGDTNEGQFMQQWLLDKKDNDQPGSGDS